MQTLGKKILIKTCYQMIWDQGLDYVSIRRIADSLDCSSAALYRHFDNLEHLLTFACIGFLEPYEEEYRLIKTQHESSLECTIAMWEALARTSFFNPNIFAHLFLGTYRNQMVDIIQEYYNIMGEDVFNVGEVSINMLEMGTLLFKNYDYIKNGNASYPPENVVIVSDLIVFTYAGMIATLQKKEYKVAAVEEMVLRFSNALKYMLK